MQLQHFGWNRTPTGDSRGLLVILASQVDGAKVDHEAPYCDQLIFGDQQQSVNGYFREISGKRFTWQKAGILAVDLTKYEAALSLDQRYAIIKKRVVEQGFDFAQWDKNG